MKKRVKKTILDPLPNDNFSLLNYTDELNENLNDRNLEFKFTDLNLTELKERFQSNKDDFDLETLNKVLNKTFSLFDVEKKNEIEIDDIKNCIYNLNLCPTESQLNEILKELDVNLNRKVKKNFKKINLKRKKKKWAMNYFHL